MARKTICTCGSCGKELILHGNIAVGVRTYTALIVITTALESTKEDVMGAEEFCSAECFRNAIVKFADTFVRESGLKQGE